MLDNKFKNERIIDNKNELLDDKNNDICQTPTVTKKRESVEHKPILLTHLEDIFKAFGKVKFKHGPSHYTILYHILFYLSPRECV